jgi:hypothetical protein
MLIFYREVLLNHSSLEAEFVDVSVQNNVLNCNVQALHICGGRCIIIHNKVDLCVIYINISHNTWHLGFVHELWVEKCGAVE